MVLYHVVVMFEQFPGVIADEFEEGIPQAEMDDMVATADVVITFKGGTKVLFTGDMTMEFSPVGR